VAARRGCDRRTRGTARLPGQNPRNSAHGRTIKLFARAHCRNIPYFENTQCEKCKSALGDWPARNRMVPLLPDGAAWRSITAGAQSDPGCRAHLRQCGTRCLQLAA
jgi:hypothetical protein